MLTTLPRLQRDDLTRLASPFTEQVLADARAIVERVRAHGEAAVRSFAQQFDEIAADDSLVIEHTELAHARDSISASDRGVLERTADRIAAFARAQLSSLSAFEMRIPGGVARQVIVPVDSAGCYAPGGRYPLPSSVLMTAVTARVAGVAAVVVASPKPTAITLAAASIAGADRLLAVGGAQAIAAMAFGAGIGAVDAIVGPGNAWVTAAKYLVSDRVRIDMLAGPSELVVIADHTADPELVAADLLAQAEHDPLARPILITVDESIVPSIEKVLAAQLQVLATANIAAQALQNGGVFVAASAADAADLCNAIAPEHLQLSVANPSLYEQKLRHYGALFIGEQSAEVLGDYGAGPNHTLPTGGTARFKGGLSVMDFLKLQTQLQLDGSDASRILGADAARLADLEGLAGHAAAAIRRQPTRAADG